MKKCGLLSGENPDHFVAEVKFKQNREMTQKTIFVLISLLLGFEALAQVGSDSEYRKMLDLINKQYEDFFKQAESNKRFESRRRRGAAAETAKRVREQEIAEVARRRYAARPKKVDNTDALEKAWEKKRQQEAKLHEERRRAFTRKQIELSKVRNSARRIPEEISSGLIPY